MEALPVFMKISGRHCVVVGGGDVALRKVMALRKAEGKVLVVSPELNAGLIALYQAGDISHLAEKYTANCLSGAVLVIAATDVEAVNAAVSRDCQALNIPINAVDAPALCTFTMPSIIDRSPLVIAISSGGAAPVLARLLRAKLEALIPASYGRLASIAAGFRQLVKDKFVDTQSRRIFWENILSGPIAERVFTGQDALAAEELAAAIQQADATKTHGEVYLVGGGPGDPDLLTFRALRLMQQCDVVVYDKLVSEGVMELVRRDAERIYVGKARDQHTLPQEDINQLLVRLAQEGKRVLRLKGGDPFIFGRGGEEIETLMANGVAFQVVPGITAAIGVSSYAGIPLTHRDYAQSVVFATGHLRDGSVHLDWASLARPSLTIVIYMGLIGLPEICRQLVLHGLPPTTPAAIIQQGTTSHQKVVVGILADLTEKAGQAQLKAPCLIIIGGVVNLREQLTWFKDQST